MVDYGEAAFILEVCNCGMVNRRAAGFAKDPSLADQMLQFQRFILWKQVAALSPFFTRERTEVRIFLKLLTS